MNKDTVQYLVNFLESYTDISTVRLVSSLFWKAVDDDYWRGRIARVLDIRIPPNRVTGIYTNYQWVYRRLSIRSPMPMSEISSIVLKYLPEESKSEWMKNL